MRYQDDREPNVDLRDVEILGGLDATSERTYWPSDLSQNGYGRGKQVLCRGKTNTVNFTNN